MLQASIFPWGILFSWANPWGGESKGAAPQPGGELLPGRGEIRDCTACEQWEPMTFSLTLFSRDEQVSKVKKICNKQNRALSDSTGKQHIDFHVL